jgi:hypothetical protein
MYKLSRTFSSLVRKLRYQSSDDEQDSLFLTAIYQSCPLLEELHLLSFAFNQQELGQIAGAGIFTLINHHCKHLRKLVLLFCELPVSILPTIAGIESLKELVLCSCNGLDDAGTAVLATTRVESLHIFGSSLFAESALQSFVGSNISQTLETFHLSVDGDQPSLIDDVQVATALASCRNLKKLTVDWRNDGCVYGRNGLDGLQAMAAGCPLLADVCLYLTAHGLHYLGTHFTNLEKCTVLNRRVTGAPTPEGFPSIEELQTLYPAVKWEYGNT